MTESSKDGNLSSQLVDDLGTFSFNSNMVADESAGVFHAQPVGPPDYNPVNQLPATPGSTNCCIRKYTL